MRTSNTQLGRGALSGLLAVMLLGLLGGCTGEISSPENQSPDGMMTGPDAMSDFEPTEPDFGEITMTPEMCEDAGLMAGASPMRLLTRYEYNNTVRDLLGATSNPADAFPKENLANGFENNAYVHVVSPRLVRQYLEEAETVAADTVANRRAEILPCDPTGNEEMCGHYFVEDFMPRAFRRPLTPAEMNDFKSLFDEGYGRWDFDTGVELVITAALQSPQFLYRLELNDEPVVGDVVQVDSWEMASRLSYFLWATMPDPELFDAASNNQLVTVDQIVGQAERMLADERSTATRDAFYRQWLSLDRLDTAAKDETMFPGFQDMSQDWKRSLFAFVDHIYRNEATLEALYTSRSLYLTPELANLYGFEPAGGLAEYVVPDGERAGLLTTPALMANLALADQSSPIQRGVFVREKLLCQHIDSPPPNLVVNPPDPDPNATTRERFAQHTESEVCANCHVKIDPIGFGFEAYDGVGHYRTVENGFEVDTTGLMADIGDPGIEGEYDGAAELAGKIVQSRMAKDCFSDTWFRYAMGRPYGDDDACSAFDIHEAFRNSGGDLNELFYSIVTSDSFRYRKVQATE